MRALDGPGCFQGLQVAAHGRLRHRQQTRESIEGGKPLAADDFEQLAASIFSERGGRQSYHLLRHLRSLPLPISSMTRIEHEINHQRDRFLSFYGDNSPGD